LDIFVPPFISKKIIVVKRYILGAFLLVASAAQAQKLKKEDKQLMANLQQHVQYLADDRLEGRRTGTPGEKLAAEYISGEFRKIGLTPKGTNDFLQPFDVSEGRQINPSTHLRIDDNTLELNKDFIPLVYSPNISIEALPSLALQEPDMPWFYDLSEMLEENASNPHFDIEQALKNKAKDLKAKGATVMFVYNSSAKEDGIKFNPKDRSDATAIPIVYITRQAAKKYFSDESAMLDIKLKVDIGEKKRTGANVVGYIDNGAPTTVVLGAHFDHLGMGEDGNSMIRNVTGQIHNGADDNASGTAALIELARMLKASKLTNNNYLFIAFSGEELGLYGSKHFVEHPTVELGKVNYMINMDMVGRLNDSSNTITVGGYGTSPTWGALYGQTGKSKLYAGPIAFRFDSSGTGPSDHSSFYRKDIPVLFYFTGLHTDYHKPSDDFDKVNYTGQMHIVKHIYSLLESQAKNNSKLAFNKTREAQTTTSARFSVTLGIMPDYTFSGNGVRVDGVSKERPAERAGIKPGDVITSLGEHKVSSVEGYMQALSKFKKGDKTTVSYQRGNQTLSSEVEF
jgi:Zn-dependent M28 family amino/carboxypeptidase